MAIIRSDWRDRFAPDPSADEDTRHVVDALNHAVAVSEAALRRVRRIVQHHGRTHIAQAITAMGEDPAELLDIYNTLRQTVHDLDTNRSIDDLPA